MQQLVDTVLCGDCVHLMKTMPDGCIDVVFADPPYRLNLRQALVRPEGSKVDAVLDDWDQFPSRVAYVSFTRTWLSECRRVLKDTGTLWVIGTYHNIYLVGDVLGELGYHTLNDVVWIKSNPMPNFRGRRLTNAHETLLWVQKVAGAKYTFNYHQLKELNGGKQMRSDWYFPLCRGRERLTNGNGKKAHSTQKPEVLLERVVLTSTKPGDLVLDPFFGTGTTGAVCKRLGRHWLGIERNASYVNMALQRLEYIRVPEA